VHCNAVASNLTLKTTFMEMGPRTKFIWSYETPICFLKSCDHKTVLYFVTTICLLLVHWKISSSYTYTTLATIEASWSFIKHSRKFWRMAVSDWSAVIYLSATGEASWSFIKQSRHFWRMSIFYWSTVFYLFGTHNAHFLLHSRITLLFYYNRVIVLKWRDMVILK